MNTGTEDNVIKTLIAVVAIICMVGCTTMQAVDVSNPRTIRERVRVGDQVSLITKAGAKYELKLTAKTAKSLFGTDSQVTWEVPYDQIASMKVLATNTRRTTTAAIITGVAVLAAVLFYGLIKLGQAVDDSF